MATTPHISRRISIPGLCQSWKAVAVVAIYDGRSDVGVDPYPYPGRWAWGYWVSAAYCYCSSCRVPLADCSLIAFGVSRGNGAEKAASNSRHKSHLSSIPNHSKCHYLRLAPSQPSSPSQQSRIITLLWWVAVDFTPSQPSVIDLCLCCQTDRQFHLLQITNYGKHPSWQSLTNRHWYPWNCRLDLWCSFTSQLTSKLKY